MTIKNKENPNVARMIENIIGCKWSLSIIAMIRGGINRPGMMEREVDGLTTKVLNERLRKLVRYGLAEKTIFPESPPRVEYELTVFGHKFVEILDAIKGLENEFSENRT
jgi:DNA-binding HxlR family transcriptional regulator